MLKNQKKQEQRWFTYLQWIFFILSFGFIGYYLYQNRNIILSASLEPLWGYLLVAFGFSVITIVLMAQKIRFIYDLENIKTKFWPVFRIVSHANIFRYIPGGIWNHAGIAAYMTVDTGESLKKTAKMQFLNVLMSLYVAFSFVIFVLPESWKYIYLMVYLASMLFINPLFQLANNLWQKLFKKQKMFLPRISNSNFLKIFVSNWFFWLSVGLAFYFSILGLDIGLPQSIGLLFYIASAYIVAWAAGFLFLPAPSGIGVREAVMAYLLAQINVTIAIGVTVSLFFRLIVLTRDLFLFAFSFINKPSKPVQSLR